MHFGMKNLQWLSTIYLFKEQSVLVSHRFPLCTNLQVFLLEVLQQFFNLTDSKFSSNVEVKSGWLAVSLALFSAGWSGSSSRGFTIILASFLLTIQSMSEMLMQPY